MRAGGVFTTHTPVPAGIDRFPNDLMQKYFTSLRRRSASRFDELMAVGQRADEPDDDRFNMAVMGLRLAGRSNGVAQLHGAVSREMFQGMWPDVPVDEVPIGAITNGVHAHTWVSDDIAELLATSVGPVWDGADNDSWAGVDKLSPSEVWASSGQGSRRPRGVRALQLRRGAARPARAHHRVRPAFRHVQAGNAAALAARPAAASAARRDRPVQFVFAGKAHPADQPGKDMIRDIELFARQLDVGHRVRVRARTTTWPSPARCTTAATCGSTTPAARSRPAARAA